jgi:hypothetical protein
MPIDREATLENAEKLFCHGRAAAVDDPRQPDTGGAKA